MSDDGPRSPRKEASRRGGESPRASHRPETAGSREPEPGPQAFFLQPVPAQHASVGQEKRAMRNIALAAACAAFALPLLADWNVNASLGAPPYFGYAPAGSDLRGRARLPTTCRWCLSPRATRASGRPMIVEAYRRGGWGQCHQQQALRRSPQKCCSRPRRRPFPCMIGVSGARTGIGARPSRASTAAGAIESSPAALLFLLLSIPAVRRAAHALPRGAPFYRRRPPERGTKAPSGNGPVFGGAVTLPFARRWAVDLDLTHFRTEREESGFRFGGNRTHFAPALQFRSGSGGQRSYGFAAFGAGVAASGTWSETRRFACLLSRHGASRFPLAPAFVAAITGRWLLQRRHLPRLPLRRAEFGVRAGVGYRF